MGKDPGELSAPARLSYLDIAKDPAQLSNLLSMNLQDPDGKVIGQVGTLILGPRVLKWALGKMRLQSDVNRVLKEVGVQL